MVKLSSDSSVEDTFQTHQVAFFDVITVVATCICSFIQGILWYREQILFLLVITFKIPSSLIQP